VSCKFLLTLGQGESNLGLKRGRKGEVLHFSTCLMKETVKAFEFMLVKILFLQPTVCFCSFLLLF